MVGSVWPQPYWSGGRLRGGVLPDVLIPCDGLTGRMDPSPEYARMVALPGGRLCVAACTGMLLPDDRPSSTVGLSGRLTVNAPAAAIPGDCLPMASRDGCLVCSLSAVTARSRT
jgi:hypothetical protein